MKVLWCGELDAAELKRWQAELSAAMPELAWAHVGDADAVAALVANPKPGSLVGQPQLRLIQSLWAGVDRLLADPTLPAAVPLARMVDPAMNAAMAETALWATLALHRGFFTYAQQQGQALWRLHAQRRADEVPVAVLGLGQMGAAVARAIALHGYPVTGWRRQDGIEALWRLLPGSQIVINLLPLTDHTRALLDARFFAALPAQASIVNLARGAHVVDADLLAALDRGHLQRAVLDVFHTEPLPPGHRFWTHPQVTMLPHAAALTDYRSASAVVAANLRALRDGRPLAHLVDRDRGY